MSNEKAPAVGAPPERNVKPLTDDSPVLLSIAGRSEVLPMTWLRARDVYVRHFGLDGIQDCREALEGCGHWRGYSDPDKRTWVAVVRASSGRLAKRPNVNSTAAPAA
jgi:hypothetical protein